MFLCFVSTLTTIFCLIASLYSPSGFASDLNNIDEILQRADALALSDNETWLKLVHYERDIFAEINTSSAIHSDIFFNSSSGMSDSRKELDETIRAFASPPKNNPNEHAQCRFRARYLWLDSKLDFDSYQIQDQQCPDFEQWSLNGTTTSISVIFATGYLGNPASYYGHTLLKLNSSEKNDRTSLEDVSVNYGAIVPPGEGPLPYILKGVFGGYSGGFSDIQYYFHNHNYGENELRDIWEYELNLSQQEVDLLVAHTWEVLGKEYTYYFLRQNCAYQMAKVLEIIEGVSVTPENPIWNLPQVLMKNIASSEHKGKPLVKEIKYHPSRQSRLYARHSSLSSLEQRLTEKIISNIEILNSDKAYLGLGDKSKLRILDTLLDYYQFIRDDEALDADPNNAKYYQVLSHRFSAVAGEEQVSFSDMSSPDLGRKPSMLRLEGVSRQAYGSGFSVTVRPAYYDSLDAGDAHVRNAELKMGELKLTNLANRMFVETATVFSVESVRATSTGLPGDKSNAWRLKLGWEQQALNCQSCLVAKFSGDIGYTHRVSSKVMVGYFLGGSLHDNVNGIGNVTTGGTVFSIVHLTDRIGVRVEGRRAYNFSANSKHETKYSLESRYEINANSALRLLYSKSMTEQYSLALDLYF